MKRKNLHLSTQTIRELTPNAMARVAGGGFSNQWFDKQSDRYVVAPPPATLQITEY